MKRRVDREPGYVLHAYPYKETSLVIDVFSRHFGRVGLLARGARRPRSALRGMLLAFHPLRLSWSGSAELATLVGAEWSGGQPALAGTGLMCGFYLNELLLKLLPREDAHERLFDAYVEGLVRLGGCEPQAAVLRGFERRMLAELGYAPLLDRDATSGAPVEAGRRYRYEPDRGPVEAEQRAAPSGPAPELLLDGRTLLDIQADDYRRAETRDQARRLMRSLIAERLGGQTLHTRSVLSELNEL
jgi:DNA repair protein RecO (recombination protein O)